MTSLKFTWLDCIHYVIVLVQTSISVVATEIRVRYCVTLLMSQKMIVGIVSAMVFCTYKRLVYDEDVTSGRRYCIILPSLGISRSSRHRWSLKLRPVAATAYYLSLTRKPRPYYLHLEILSWRRLSTRKLRCWLDKLESCGALEKTYGEIFRKWQDWVRKQTHMHRFISIPNRRTGSAWRLWIVWIIDENEYIFFIRRFHYVLYMYFRSFSHVLSLAIYLQPTLTTWLI